MNYIHITNIGKQNVKGLAYGSRVASPEQLINATDFPHFKGLVVGYPSPSEKHSSQVLSENMVGLYLDTKTFIYNSKVTQIWRSVIKEKREFSEDYILGRLTSESR